jgi:hypothetical protein
VHLLVINPAAMNSECGHYYPKVQLRRAGVQNFLSPTKTDWVRRTTQEGCWANATRIYCTPGVNALFCSTRLMQVRGAHFSSW